MNWKSIKHVNKQTWHGVQPVTDAPACQGDLKLNISHMRWLTTTLGGNYHWEKSRSLNLETGEWESFDMLWFENLEDWVLYKLTWSDKIAR